jgi:CRISPR-associated endonuclease Cas1
MSTLIVTTQGAYVRKHGGQVVVTHKDEVVTAMPEAMLEALMLVGAVQVSTQAVTELLDRGIPLIYLSRGGQFRGLLVPGWAKHARRRLAHYACAIDAGFARETARSLVAAKIRSSVMTLEKWRRNDWGEVGEALAAVRVAGGALARCRDVAGIRAVEAQAAKAHFSGLAGCLPPAFPWRGRSRRPPRDPINALLSFGYMMLVGLGVGAVHAAGLDPDLGFLHGPEYGRPGLALDLVEPLRAPFADHAALLAVRSGLVGPEEFTEGEETGCRLSPEALRRYAGFLHRRLDPGATGGAMTALEALAGDIREAVEAHRAPVWGAMVREAA